MQIRNFVWYVLSKPLGDPGELAAKLSDHRFKPCNHQQQMSQGWVAPVGDELVYEAHGAQLLMLKQEKRLLPGSVVNEYLQQKIEHFEAEEGYKPGRKVRQQMKDDLIIELLPKAFTKSSRIPVLVFPRQGWLLVLGGSAKTAEDATTFLRTSLGSLPTALVNVDMSPSHQMTRWLMDPLTLPADWMLGEEVELVDEEKATVKVRNQDLLGDELTVHTQAGKVVSKLALVWREQVSLLLQEDLAVKRIKLLLEDDEPLVDGDDADAKFAHEFAISCNWVVPLCESLLTAFGGLDKALSGSQERAFAGSL